MVRIHISQFYLEFEQTDKAVLLEIIGGYEPVKRRDRTRVYGEPEKLYALLVEVAKVYDIELI